MNHSDEKFVFQFRRELRIQGVPTDIETERVAIAIARALRDYFAHGAVTVDQPRDGASFDRRSDYV